MSELRPTERVRALHAEVLGTRPALCAERALLVTRYFRDLAADRGLSVVEQQAEALCFVLREKQVRIHPRELLVGCYTSHRVGGGLFPELHGVVVLEDLLRRSTANGGPLAVDPGDRRRLLREVLPYWLPRFLAVRAQPLRRAVGFFADQLSPTFTLINETGGISHFVPDYAALIARGTDGFRQEIEERLAQVGPTSNQAAFLRATRRVCDGLDSFADGYRRQAEALAAREPEPERRGELERIARICARVPRQPARTLHEALQSILFAQIALNLESLDNSVCPGRLDQILWPVYQAERDAGTLDPEHALELFGCFAVKLCELVPAFSRRITRFHGGLFNGQVVAVGGTDRDGQDATNELSYLLLELMDRLRTRQPNYHARLHPGSPAAFRARAARAIAAGAASPALYNDRVIAPLLESRGVGARDARDYCAVGCVEPVAAGKSFFSTDAALFNLPLCLELALGQGRRFGHRRRIGARTPPAESCRTMQDVVELFAAQVQAGITRLLPDLEVIERGNARFHPTPLTSMLLDGCLESGRDASAGGARYNGSGVQGVGVVEVGDSLAALDTVVFQERAATLGEVIAACRADFRGAEKLRARLARAPKYGNDDPNADRWVGRAMQVFADALRGHRSTRGGDYVAGFYSVTSHVAFGAITGALPSGRGAGAPFSSGLSPGSGRDRKGPTAALASYAALPLGLAHNGVNYNLELPPWTLEGETGTASLGALVDGAFRSGCMQLQVNVIDPQILIEARDHPGRYPGLLVRVSGYSAYFDDLGPDVKQELIDRWTNAPAA